MHLGNHLIELSAQWINSPPLWTSAGSWKPGPTISLSLTFQSWSQRVLNSSIKLQGFSGSVVNNLPGNAGDTRDAGSIPRTGRSPGGGNGNPLQYSCLENSTDKATWQATVHGVAKTWAWLSNRAHQTIRNATLNKFPKYSMPVSWLVKAYFNSFFSLNSTPRRLSISIYRAA